MTHTIDPQNQPAKKKSSKTKKVLIGTVAAVAVIAVFQATSGGDENTAPASGTEAAVVVDKGSEALPGIGAEVRDGKFAFTVTEVETGIAQAGDNPYVNKVAQGQFIFVHVDVKNVGDKPQSYFDMNQKLIDAQGREYSNDTEAGIYANTNYTVGDINPGNTASVVIVFDVPADAQPKTVELHDSMFSGGTEVAIG